MRFDGQQRVMRLSGALLRSPAAKQVLTNRMRENFTYGSVGGAEGNLGSYPARFTRPIIINGAFKDPCHPVKAEYKPPKFRFSMGCGVA